MNRTSENLIFEACQHLAKETGFTPIFKTYSNYLNQLVSNFAIMQELAERYTDYGLYKAPYATQLERDILEFLGFDIPKPIPFNIVVIADPEVEDDLAYEIHGEELIYLKFTENNWIEFTQKMDDFPLQAKIEKIEGIEIFVSIP